MRFQRHIPPYSGPLMILFFVITFVSAIASLIYYNYQKNSLLTERQRELSEISYFKIKQITQWRIDRINEGVFLGDNKLLVKKISEFLHSPGNSETRNEINSSLLSMTENLDFTDALFIGKDGKNLVSFQQNDSIYADHLKTLLPDIISQRKTVLTELDKSDQRGREHFDLFIPIIDHGSSDTLVLGLLVLRIDPQKILYPLVQSWPTPDNSIETLLLRREGNGVEYLTDRRYQETEGQNFAGKNSGELTPEIMMADGITGTTDGIDYRNVRIVAAVNKIPGTHMYLLVKTDRRDILSALSFQIKMILIILVCIIITSGTILIFIIRNQRVKYYREKYEAELKRLALIKHFDYILKYANDIILLFDAGLTIVEANDRAMEFYQYSREEFIGMKLKNIRAFETLSGLQAHVDTVNTNESATFETVHRKKDGTTFPVEISTRLVFIEGVRYYQSIGRDITERKNVENILRESENKFRKIFEESPFSIIMTGKDLGIISANSSFCNLIGYNEEELKLFTFRNFTHRDYIAEDEIAMLKLIAGEIPVYNTEKRYICKDGSVIWGSTSVSIIRNEKDQVQFFLIMIEDITSRKKVLAELDNSVSLLKATIESTEDGLLVVDSVGKIVLYNQKFCDMWRIPLEVLETGEDINALTFVKNELSDPDTFLENIKHLYSDPEATSFDLLEFADNRYFERYSQPQKIGGKSVGRVWSFRDITEQKKAEADLIAAKEKAEEGDRLKTAFLHNVSHEIRTPMNAIIGFSSLLNEPGLDEHERRQYIDIIFQSGNQLLSIINDIVDIANVESGQAKINPVKFNLNSALKSLNEQFSMHVKHNNVTLNLTTGLNDEDSMIVTDSTKLVQIISNLINNAIKFTKNGRIDFGYSIKGDMIEFFIKDTGIGIVQEYHSRIFDRFFQVDSAISRQYSGTGLGLSICKGYVEMLGGSIKVESEPGKGTLFIFTVPYSME